MKKLLLIMFGIFFVLLSYGQGVPTTANPLILPSNSRPDAPTTGFKVYNFNKFLEARDSIQYSRLVRGFDLIMLRDTIQGLQDSTALYLKVDGSRPLTGDWNAGNYKILNTDTIQGQVVLAVGSMKTPTLQVTGLTSGRVPFVSTDGLIVDNGNFTYSAASGTLMSKYSSTCQSYMRANVGNVGIRAQFSSTNYINNTASVTNSTMSTAWQTTGVISSTVLQNISTGTFLKISRSDPNYWWEVHSGLTEGIVPYFKFYNADFEYSVPVATMDLSEGNLLIGDYDGSTSGYIVNTDIFSNGIHGLRIKTDGNTEIINHLFVDTISNGSTDVNKFLVSDNHEIKFRTDTQVKSDLGLVVGTNLLPTGTTGQTIFFNGTAWVANSNIIWNGAALVTPTAKYTTGATPGYFWSCTNADGSGEWVPFTGAVYKGQVDGDTGIPVDSVDALIDGTGVTGWWLVCIDAGTYDYGNPSGNVIVLEVGDQLYYNGTKWISIPGAGSYVLPTATASVLGGVKIGNSLSISAQVLDLKDGDKGDIDIGSTGTVFTVDTAAITYDKIQNISGQWKVLGRSSAGTGVVEEFSMSGTGNLLGSLAPVVSDSLRVANIPYGIAWINSTGVPTKGALVSIIEKINDSIANHSINYYTLRDTVQTSMTDIVNLQDSITKHTDTLELHRVQIASKQAAGNYALVNQTMYIGTTGVAINRGSGNLTLVGITLTTPTFTGPILGTPASGNLVNCIFPTLNQSTTGSAAKWTDDRRIYGHWIDGSANQDSTIVVAYGGTGLATITANSYLKGNGTGSLVPRTYAEVRTDLGLGTMALETASRYRLQTQHDSLSLLDDVTISGIANGELIRWNGSKFINNTLDEAGIQSIVNLSTYNQNLIYNSSPYTTAETGIYATNSAGSQGGFSTEFNVLYLSRTSSDTHVMALNGAIVDIYTAQLKSTVTTGTKPFNIISTTLVDNLNAEFLDGHKASYFSSSVQLNSKLDTTLATVLLRGQWSAAYTNRIASLTTTGNSGAATLLSNVLNIPTYTLAGLGGQPAGTYSTDIHSNITALNAVSGVNTGDNAVNSLYSGLVSFPGFGTSHSTAAYGDHLHANYATTATVEAKLDTVGGRVSGSLQIGGPLILKNLQEADGCPSWYPVMQDDTVKYIMNMLECIGGQPYGSYATGAQGTKADNAMPKAGGIFTGAVRYNDNVRAEFGSSGASNSYIYWSSGALYYMSSNYHTFMDINSNRQFETKATGVNIISGKTYQIADKSIVSDSAFNADWNGNHAYTVSKDALYDKFKLLEDSVNSKMKTPSVQALTGTTSRTYNVNNGIHATMTIGGNTTITFSNLVAGQTGNLTVTNPVENYTITFAGYTNKIAPAIKTSANIITVSGSNQIDIISWYYDGTYVFITGTKNMN